MREPARVAILGGTFDPIHRGHVEPLLAVADSMGWDRILFVPAATQPFKTGRASSEAHHRWAMAALAISGNPRLLLSDIELKRGEISYTVDTLDELRRAYPASALEWIIGDDNLGLLTKWRSVERIFELANFVVLTRHEDGAGGVARAPLVAARITTADNRGKNGGIVFARNVQVPVSATDIRRRVRAGEGIRDLVDPLVARYIQHNRLYQEVQT